jgi:hypothetical protein
MRYATHSKLSDLILTIQLRELPLAAQRLNSSFCHLVPQDSRQG